LEGPTPMPRTRLERVCSPPFESPGAYPGEVLKLNYVQICTFWCILASFVYSQQFQAKILEGRKDIFAEVFLLDPSLD